MQGSASPLFTCLGVGVVAGGMRSLRALPEHRSREGIHQWQAVAQPNAGCAAQLFKLMLRWSGRSQRCVCGVGSRHTPFLAWCAEDPVLEGQHQAHNETKSTFDLRQGLACLLCGDCGFCASWVHATVTRIWYVACAWCLALSASAVCTTVIFCCILCETRVAPETPATHAPDAPRSPGPRHPPSAHERPATPRAARVAAPSPPDPNPSVPPRQAASIDDARAPPKSKPHEQCPSTRAAPSQPGPRQRRVAPPPTAARPARA